MHTPHRTFRWRLPWTFSHVRLPRAVRAALSSSRRDVAVRDREGRGHHARDAAPTRVHTDRGDLRAPAGRRRARLAPGAVRVAGRRRSSRPRRALSRGLEVHPHGALRGPRAVARPPLRARGLRVELPGGRRGARRRRLVRSALPRQGADARAGRGARRPSRPLPGQLDPPPLRPADRGRRLLRRRQRRPLPAADRRGHPHGALLRPRLRARAARRVEAGRAASRRWRATTRSRSRTAGRSRRCGTCSRCSAPSTARRARPRS